MDDTRLVGCLQRLGDLRRNRKGLVNGDRPLGDAVGEGGAFDELEDQRTGVVALLEAIEAIDGGDIGVVETRQDLRFPLEPGQAIRIVREFVRQDLERDLTVELRVGGLPDLAHPALADESGHLVVAEAGLRSHRHRSVGSIPRAQEAVHNPNRVRATPRRSVRIMSLQGLRALSCAAARRRDTMTRRIR